MFSPLATELLVQAQVEEIYRLAKRGDSAHRYFSFWRKSGTPRPVEQQTFRHAWEDPALVKMQMAGESSSYPR